MGNPNSDEVESLVHVQVVGNISQEEVEGPDNSAFLWAHCNSNLIHRGQDNLTEVRKKELETFCLNEIGNS